jgi:hypothetical protein
MEQGNLIIDEQYWREFAIKFARKRGIHHPEQLADLQQDALAKIYGLNLTRIKTQTELERFIGRSVANMIRDWQRKEKPRTHAQLFDFTHHLNTTAKMEQYFADYADSLIGSRIDFANGQSAILDTADYERAESLTWHLKDCGDKAYVRAWTGGKHQYLHRFIVGGLVRRMPKDSIVSFINGNTLDYRRSNLALNSLPLQDLL